jgi:chorismate mutase/prephenate dehydratase
MAGFHMKSSPTTPEDNGPTSVAKIPAEVRQLRAQIDAFDRQIVELVNARAEKSRALGLVKQLTSQATYDPAREEQIFDRLAKLNDGPLSDESLRAVFREIVSGSRALAKRLRVAYLGPDFSYSHLAAIQRFGQSVDLVAVGTITAAFEEVEAHQTDFGIVPLENSTDGRIADTLENFARKSVRICGEVQLAIHHQLLGRCARNDVREVYSKPQALSQCRNWLARHVPSARLVEVASTTAAADIARDRDGAAAIASRQAAANYGLEVLAANIEDNPSNVTRFAVLGHEPAGRTGDDKTSLMFELAHQPGSLADALNVFKRQRVNLTWLESFPMSGAAGPRPTTGHKPLNNNASEYLFFVELEGHEKDLRVRRAIDQLRKKSLRLTVLGSYARSEPVG